MDTIEELTGTTKKQAYSNVSGLNAKVAVSPKQPSRFSFSAQAAAFENARYFWMSVLMTAQSCLGAVACMFILYTGGNIVALATCAAVTMGSNAMFIGLASPRICLGVLYTSVTLNLAFILSNPI